MKLQTVSHTREILWISAGAIVGLIVIVVVVLHVRKVHELRQWCHDHGYTYYVTRDDYCVDLKGSLVKAGEDQKGAPH
jgi:hypothetical protein